MEGLRASSSNALIPITVDPSDTLDCQVGLRHGAGLSVFQFSAFAARPIQWVVDKFAADPTASKSFIDDFFGHNDTRETALDDLYEDQDCSSSRFKALQHHLDRLLKLARPKSNTIDSQLMVFKILATVITRYPGVRRRLQTHKDLKKASVRDPSLTSLWNRPDQSCGDEWNFDREFAIFCISDSSLTKLLEAEPPAMLSRVDLGGTLNKVPIEDLMGHSKAGPDFQPFRICAIRYLGGLLELPGFWRRCPPPTGSAPERKRFSEVLCTLCDTILLLLEDTKGVASSYSLRSGRMAVDLLSCAMLKGIIRLHNLDNLPPCPDKLPEIVSILRNDIEGNFPRAFEPSCEVHNMLAILTTVPHHQFNQLEMKFDRDYSGTRLELSYLEHNNNFKPRILLRSTLYPNSQGGNASIHKDIMVCVDGLEISVAVKLMNHSSDEDARAHCQRLDCEAFVWSRQDHRNIVPFLGVFDLPGCHFPVLISPYYEFGHIGKYLGNNPRAMKIPLMHDVVSGMKHLHDHGVVHGDVKPENFLVDKHGVACVIDFGTSRIQGIKGFTTSHRPSTSVYYAPEMWGAPDEAGAEASFKSDVWAVACVLLGIMGSFPIKTVAKLRHQGSNFVTLRSDLADLLRPTREQYAPDVVPDHIWAVLKKCWALDPEERQTMVAIHAFFEELVG